MMRERTYKQLKVDPADLERFQAAARANGQTAIGAFRVLAKRFEQMTKRSIREEKPSATLRTN